MSPLLGRESPRLSGPRLDVFTLPDPAGGDDRLGGWEAVCLAQLVGSLATDAEQLADLLHAQ